MGRNSSLLWGELWETHTRGEVEKTVRRAQSFCGTVTASGRWAGHKPDLRPLPRPPGRRSAHRWCAVCGACHDVKARGWPLFSPLPKDPEDVGLVVAVEQLEETKALSA